MTIPPPSAFARLPRPLRIAVVALAAGVLLWLSLAPNDELPGSGLVWDKAAHAISYLILMMVGLLFAPRRLLAFTAFAFGLGGGVEILQAAMGFGRHGDWRDLFANSVGIVTGFSLWALAIRRRPAWA